MMIEALQLINWILCMFGITYIFTDSYILSVPRNYIAKKSKVIGMFLTCNICFSFWAGLALSLLYFSPTGYLLLDGCLSTGILSFLSRKGY